ncbi:MAG TPA: hypothetical protein VIM84_14785 [Gemmatimonadales bacterium]
MPAAAIPAIIGAAGSVGAAGLGYLSSRKAGRQSPAELQAQQAQQGYQRELAGQGRELTQTGRTLTQYGLPQLQQATGYFSKLASGGRGVTNQVLAPETERLNAVYGGTQRTLSRFLRGPDRDYQMGELARERAGAIGGLARDARQAGVAGLVNLGQYGVEAGRGFAGAGANAMSGAAGIASNVASQAGNARIAGADLQRQAGADIGGLVFQLLKGMSGRAGGRSGGGGFTIPSLPVTGGLPPGQIGTTSPIPKPPLPGGSTFPQNPKIYGGVRF